MYFLVHPRIYTICLFIKSFSWRYQRLLNDLERTMLSAVVMIWLLSRPPPSPVSKLDRRHTGRLRKRDNLLLREGWRGWGRSQTTRLRESLILHKSFNIWYQATARDMERGSPLTNSPEKGVFIFFLPHLPPTPLPPFYSANSFKMLEQIKAYRKSA
jgi:hypothetical protein